MLFFLINNRGESRYYSKVIYFFPIFRSLFEDISFPRSLIANIVEDYRFSKRGTFTLGDK